MKIQAFIPAWDSPRSKPVKLYNLLDLEIETVVLTSYNVPFSVQWEEAVSRFTGDVFLWAMADTYLRRPGQLSQMMDTMFRVYGRGDVAMYAPDVNYTDVTYDKSKLKEIEPNICEVAATDLVFASLSRELLLSLPSLGANTHGWAYDYLATFIANKAGKKVVRDYNIMIDHPYGKAYKEPEAFAQMRAWIDGLSPEYQRGIMDQME